MKLGQKFLADIIILHMCFVVDIMVSFSQSTYSVSEDGGLFQIGLVLSNPSSADITVQVTNTDESATGEYCSILINY